MAAAGRPPACHLNATSSRLCLCAALSRCSDQSAGRDSPLLGAGQVTSTEVADLPSLCIYVEMPSAHTFCPSDPRDDDDGSGCPSSCSCSSGLRRLSPRLCNAYLKPLRGYGRQSVRITD